MTYKTNNAEKLSVQLIYYLAISAFVVFILFRSNVIVWLCSVIPVVILLIRNYTILTIGDDGVHTVRPLRKKSAVLAVSEVCLRKKGTSSIYIIFPFEVFIYYRKSKSMKRKEVGRIKLSNEKEMEEFIRKTKERRYLWRNSEL